MDASPAGAYHPVTKAFHWGIFFVMAGQFLVGYTLGNLEDEDPGEDRLFTLHALLGMTILVLSIFRLMWRRRQTLPPWAPTLTPFERRYSHTVERLLYVLALVIPLSGLALAVVDERPLPVFGQWEISEVLDDSDVEDLFEGVHIATHLVFFVVFALHVGLVIKHQFVDRDRLFNRML
ncbi:MAG TPA: cytochrome b [Acidimicrobiia bacterium]|nr:cytochrome b [Acidimicrobiia bacterium]